MSPLFPSESVADAPEPFPGPHLSFPRLFHTNIRFVIKAWKGKLS